MPSQPACFLAVWLWVVPDSVSPNRLIATPAPMCLCCWEASLSRSRHGVGVRTYVFTAYVSNGSYSYMTSSATEFLHSLTLPGAPGAQIVHSQVEVRPPCPSGACWVPGVRWDVDSRENNSRPWNRWPECRCYPRLTHEVLEAQRG